MCEGRPMNKQIVVAALMQESNTFSPRRTTEADFTIRRGQALLDLLPVVPLLQAAGCSVIPAVYARALPGGYVSAEVFKGFMAEILAALAAHPADGIWLYLHGAMEVEDLGSGETVLLQAIRAQVGWNVPVAVALDLHANNTPELIRYANIVVGYRTAPHVDEAETQLKAGQLLLRCLEQNVLPRPLGIRIPLLITGEQATTGIEPMRTLVRRIEELEQLPQVWSASIFVGMAWVDTTCSGFNLIIIPEPGQESVVLEPLLQTARLVWNARLLFRYEEETAEPEETPALAAAAAAAGNRPFFLTDSGDDVTAGATGDRIDLLDLFLKRSLTGVLFAGIADQPAVSLCRNLNPGTAIDLTLGGTIDPSAGRWQGRAILLWAGTVQENSAADRTEAVLLRFAGSPQARPAESVDAIVTAERRAFTDPDFIESAPVKIKDYPILVVKQGYLFARLRAVAAGSLMVLTDGSSCMQINRFDYTRVARPVFPLDPDMSWEPQQHHIV